MYCNHLFKIFIVILVLSSILYTPVTTIAGSSVENVFSASDPVGDDKGPGTYVYPTNNVFIDGAFDLTGFKVVYDRGNDRVFFITYVRELGDDPWNSTNGFSLQYIHIYVYTRANYTPRTDTIGLNVLINPGWHFAILLCGGWPQHPGPLPDGEMPTIYYYDGGRITESERFKVYVNESDNSIIAEIDPALLLDVEHIDEWGYAVLLTGYDGYSPDGTRVRQVQVSSGEWVFGGADQAALQAGVAPRVIDLLANASSEQYSMLSSYNPVKGELAVVNILFPGNATNIVPPTPETTTTPTSPKTTSHTPTTSKTMKPSKTRTPSPKTSPTKTTTTSPGEEASPALPFKPKTETPPPSPGVSSDVAIIVYLAFIVTAIIVIVVIIKTARS